MQYLNLLRGINVFKWLCGRHQQKTKSIAVGDLYGLIDKSPWSKGNVVTILDVKDGWVRYYMNPFFCNEVSLILMR